MIATPDVSKIARARLKDAQVLLAAKRYDGAIYLCGYAVELGLKARICRALKWAGYPSSRKEFEGLQTFRTHDLDLLLRLTGREQGIKTTHFAEWSAVAQWNPEARYQPVGTATATDAQIMIQAAEILLKKL
jgi:HEPN domain-containing protein